MFTLINGKEESKVLEPYKPECSSFLLPFPKSGPHLGACLKEELDLGTWLSPRELWSASTRWGYLAHSAEAERGERACSPQRAPERTLHSPVVATPRSQSLQSGRTVSSLLLEHEGERWREAAFQNSRLDRGPALIQELWHKTRTGELLGRLVLTLAK